MAAVVVSGVVSGDDLYVAIDRVRRAFFPHYLDGGGRGFRVRRVVGGSKGLPFFV